MKKCNKCGIEKELNNFTKSKSTKDGHYSVCKNCRKSYYLENKDKLLDYQNEYNDTNRLTVSKRNRNWKESNRDKSRSYGAKRWAAKHERCPDWLTNEDFEEIQKFYSIAKKLTEETGIKHHVDHIIPMLGRTVCGLHVPWNLQVLTEKENLVKGIKYNQDQ